MVTKVKGSVSQDVERAASRAYMKGRDVPAGHQFSLEEGARSGSFVFRAGDQSANVTADPQEGEWVAPDSDPTGASGAYQRIDNQILNDEMFGNTGAASLIVPEAVSDDGVFYQRASAQDGLLTSSKTLVDDAEHIFDASSRAYKARSKNGIALSKYGEADIPRLGDQIAQNVETFVTDGDRIYAICKGSYSLNDSSLLATYQVTPTGVSSLGSTVNLGTGADCRAMGLANGFLYIFKGDSILVYKTEDYAPPELITTVSRPNAGFVQTCSIINGLLVAPVWGASKIETYSINERGYPVLHEDFDVTAGSSNSSVVDANDGSYLLIRHVSGTDALGRFFFDAEGYIDNMTYFTVPEMLQCRYGVVRNSYLYTGSFSTGDLIEVRLAPQTISSAARTFENMSSFIVYDNYIIGARTDTFKNSAINLTDGSIYELNSNLRWLYPQTYDDTFITFVAGDEPDAPGAQPNDSPMGQKIAVYKLRQNAQIDFPKSPTVRSIRSINTGSNCESSYELFGLSSGFNSLGSVKQFDALGYAWLELKVSGFVVDNQASSSSAFKVFEGRALLLYSVGTWKVKQAYADDVSKGASAVTFQLSAGTGLVFGVNTGGALSGAIVRLKVEIRSQNEAQLSL